MRTRFAVIAILGAALACDKPAPAPRTPTFRDIIVERGRARAATRPDSFSMAADRGRVEGDSAAPLWLVVVGDFQCERCKRWNDDVLPLIRNEYVATHRLRLAFLNMPKPEHLNAMPTALAAACASAQGKFWETSAKIFATQANWKDLPDARPYLDSLAIAAGADAKTLRFCTEAARAQKFVYTDVDRNKAAGVDSLPTFFIGQRKLVGAAPITTFRTIIDSALKAK